MSDSEKVQIGNVWVDAGLVWIGDPCYVLGGDASNGVKTWEEFCTKLDEAGRHDSASTVYTAPLGEGIGFAVDSGYGDGSYPVTLELVEDTLFGGGGKRVKSLTVTFIEDEPNDE